MTTPVGIIGAIFTRTIGGGIAWLIARRYVIPGCVQYVIAQITRPYVLPLAGVAVGAITAGAVTHYVTQGRPGIVRWINQGLVVGGVLVGVGAVAVAVIHLVALNNQGPLIAFVDGVTQQVATAVTTVSDDYTGALIG